MIDTDIANFLQLGAFGFLSSDDMKKHGNLNAGILDQRLVLKWVQKYAQLFGGNSRNVTIYGDSARRGSVILHAMAHGGTNGNRLFQKVCLYCHYQTNRIN